jgi:ribonuclease HI
VCGSTDLDNSHRITYNPNAVRWLGYWLDPKLTFNHHHQKWLTRARQQQARLARLCRSQGLPPASTANLQKAVVQSVATYGSEINAARRYPSRDVGRIAGLQLILNWQARAATGCLRTTPLGFLMAEGATRPAEAIVRGREAGFRSRILTRAAPPPASTHRRATPTEDVIRCLTQRAASRCGFLEVENICQPSPSGHNPGDIIIAPRAEAELTARNWRTLDTECIWMDGSRMEDHTGVGFVREVNGALVSSEFYLGKHVEVFDAELFAIYQALRDFWANKFWRHDPPMAVTIFSDAQAALVCLRSDSPRPGQKLGRLINVEAAELWKWGIPVQYRWVPGHSDIPENEAANAAAKRATKHRCTAGTLI